jgi:hypothetical protein
LFSAEIFLDLMILYSQISDMNDRRQKADCMERYRRGDKDESSINISFIDAKRDEECRISVTSKGDDVFFLLCIHILQLIGFMC